MNSAMFVHTFTIGSPMDRLSMHLYLIEYVFFDVSLGFSRFGATMDRFSMHLYLIGYVFCDVSSMILEVSRDYEPHEKT